MMPSWNVDYIVDYFHFGETIGYSITLNYSYEINNEWLFESANNKSHSRHFTVDFCKELGLNITELESDQTLQELVLSVHHAFIITIDATAATKLIENQNGARYITSQKK